MNDALFQQAIRHHQAGQLAEAEGLYRQILGQDPNHAHALNLLGVIAIQVGSFPVAIELIRRAIAIDAHVAEFHNNLGMSELAVNSHDEYRRKAVELAGDLPRLAELRAKLRARVEASPLMDGVRFARNMEAAYRTMWRRWCAT